MFPDMLVYLRKRNNMTQAGLAQKLGLSRSAVSMYESGQREPDFETLEAIADVFNVNMSVLIDKPRDEENDELSALLEQLRTREDMRMLFKLAKDATPQDVMRAVRIIEELRK